MNGVHYAHQLKMKKDLLKIILIFGLLQSVQSQNKSDILIIDLKHDILVSPDKLVKEISVQRGFLKKTKKSLLQQCIDSTRYYSGNCFKVIYYDDNEYVVIRKGQGFPDYIRGYIYALEDKEIQNIRTNIENYKPSKEKPEIIDSVRVTYEVNLVFQYGGESKLALFLPKINVLRKHIAGFINPYYGLELGLHAGFVAEYGSLSAIVGVEKNIFNLETSVSHFRTTKIRDVNGGFNGPFSQNLLNLKFGVRIKNLRIKVGTSILLNESVPQGQERIPLLDIGKINNNIWGIELQINLRNNWRK
jgi:hypothetical protein